MQVGDRVNRIEDREVTAAIVVEIEGENALIAYEEGGQGWWPANSLKIVQDEA